MAVVRCVKHSFQSHQLLHRHLLPVNKLCRQTALPCALICWRPVQNIKTWNWHALCHRFHIHDDIEHCWRRTQGCTRQKSRCTHGTVAVLIYVSARLFVPSVLFSTESPICLQRFENDLFSRLGCHGVACCAVPQPRRCARVLPSNSPHPFCSACVSPSHEGGLCKPTWAAATFCHPWSHVAWA